MMHWDDLRWVLAVAEAGGTDGVDLGASRSTVYRRLSAIETRLGPLFERHPTGWVTTPRGTMVVQAARDVADRMRGLEEALAVQDGALTGEVRLTVVAAMAPLMPAILADFRRAWPGVRVDLVVDDATLSLARREADVALRVVGGPPPGLVGRRLARVAFAVYGRRELLRDHADPLATAPWVAFDGVSGSPADRWQAANVPAERVVVRTNSRAAFLALLEQGAGVGLAPCGLADGVAGLIRAGPPLPELTVPLWVLWPEALRSAPRVTVLARFLVEAVESRRERIEGRSA